jgi:hemerythrin
MSPEEFKQLNLVTGDTRIDFEHLQIVNTLVRLKEPMLTKAMRIAVTEKLLHYIGEHCAEEEQLMQAYDYDPELIIEHRDAHLQLQRDFLAKLSDFICEYNAIAISEIYSIFINHIVQYDSLLVTYIKSTK